MRGGLRQQSSQASKTETLHRSHINCDPEDWIKVSRGGAVSAVIAYIERLAKVMDTVILGYSVETLVAHIPLTSIPGQHFSMVVDLSVERVCLVTATPF